ncbi:hypothetical protein [Planosporangium thailandense]|uniref:hypothetical protein n=1 Tax=Planosporangium thailandense TaxID=765197 RepID=UPI001F0E0B73|nr:hypothetical protein [Planosporangium thailandense]
MNTLTLLADNLAQNNFGDTQTGGLAGPMGLFIILVLIVGTVLLIRNMNSRLRRLPNKFTSAGPSGDRAPGRVSSAAEPHGDERPQP